VDEGVSCDVVIIRGRRIIKNSEQRAPPLIQQREGRTGEDRRGGKRGRETQESECSLLISEDRCPNYRQAG
jgi:hypothetical protein